VKPAFIVIEGVDRCGKSLQAEMLARRLTRGGIPTRLLSTPDYTSPAGVAVARHLGGSIFLASVEKGSNTVHRSVLDALTFECLQICDRYAVADQVRKSLASGESVVCVRWWQSALLYGADDEVDPIFIRAVCSSLPEADLNLLLSASSASVAPRRDLLNRYESNHAKQERLKEAYARLWKDEEGRRGLWRVVDGNGEPSNVAEKVWQATASIFNS
jgi:dTMP kinase